MTMQKQNPGTTEEPAADVPEFAVRHYSPAEIAQLWGFSQDSVRKIFENEPVCWCSETLPVAGNEAIRPCEFPRL